MLLIPEFKGNLKKKICETPTERDPGRGVLLQTVAQLFGNLREATIINDCGDAELLSRTFIPIASISFYFLYINIKAFALINLVNWEFKTGLPPIHLFFSRFHHYACPTGMADSQILKKLKAYLIFQSICWQKQPCSPFCMFAGSCPVMF